MKNLLKPFLMNILVKKSLSFSTLTLSMALLKSALLLTLILSLMPFLK